MWLLRQYCIISILLVRPSIRLSICLSVRLSISLSVCLSVSHSLSLSLSLSFSPIPPSITPSMKSSLTDLLTFDGRTNTPWLGRHLKYLVPEREPSFLPWAWSSSTPIHILGGRGKGRVMRRATRDHQQTDRHTFCSSAVPNPSTTHELT